MRRSVANLADRIGEIAFANFTSRSQRKALRHGGKNEQYTRKAFEKAQESEVVAAPEEADLILTMEKSAEGKGVSLVDRNFYLDK